jgi:hypothetical protein
MEQKKDVMERVKMLPENFDGVVRFTNWSDEDFTGRWNSKDYLFKANTTSPISTIMPEFTPLELLNVCKKFAKDLAVREWGKTQWMKDALKRERNVDGSPRGYGMSGAATYSDDQLAPMIQKGLYVYTTASAKITDAPKQDIQEKLHRDDDGKVVTKAVKHNASMKELANSFDA